MLFTQHSDSTSLQQVPLTVTVEPPLVPIAGKIKTGVFHNGLGRWLCVLVIVKMMMIMSPGSQHLLRLQTLQRW